MVIVTLFALIVSVLIDRIYVFYIDVPSSKIVILPDDW